MQDDSSALRLLCTLFLLLLHQLHLRSSGIRSHRVGTPASILSRIDMGDVFSFSFHRCNLRRICRLFKAIHPVSGGAVVVQNQKQQKKRKSSSPWLGRLNHRQCLLLIWEVLEIRPRRTIQGAVQGQYYWGSWAVGLLAGPVQPWDPRVFSLLSGKSSLPARAQAQTLPEARCWLCQSKTTRAPSEMRTRPASARRRTLP